MIVIHMISLDICVSISISIIYLYISRCGRSSAFLLKNCAKPEALKHRGDRWVADTGLQLPLQGTHHWEGNGPKPGLQTGTTSSFVIWKLRSNIKTFLNCHGWMDGWTQWIQWMDGSISPYFPNPIHTQIYTYIYFLFVWDTPWHRFSLRTDGFFLGAPRISRTTAVVCPERGILPASWSSSWATWRKPSMRSKAPKPGQVPRKLGGCHPNKMGGFKWLN